MSTTDSTIKNKDLSNDIDITVQEETIDEENSVLESEIQKAANISSWFDEIYKNMKLFF